MAPLSSHPLSPDVLNAPGLRRIYEAAGPASNRPRAVADDLPARDEPSGPRRCLLGGRYELGRYLDEGGTAEIYAARDQLNGAEVALKILKPQAEADVRLRRYFLHGARGAQRVEHPNVVRIFDVVEPEHGAPFAAMEIVDGPALSSCLADHTSLRPEVALELALQAASGLEAAHRRGLVHCDVKPENLLLEQAASRGVRLRVIDFDLAAVDDEGETHEHPLLRGTARYMAPEQVVGDGVDPRTDVYGLGVVLFRMLTGHLPFDLELCPTLLFHQFASPCPPPSWLTDGLDARFDAVVLCAVSKVPEHRYASMSELIADLHALRTGAPLRAERPRSRADVYEPRTASSREAARLITRAI